MPRKSPWLEDQDSDDDTLHNEYGWNQPPPETWDVPPWMERTGALVLPEWMRTADGSCSVDYKAGMVLDKPNNYIVSLNDPPTEEELNAIPPKPLCRFFKKNNHCKNGDSCYYSHDLEAAKKDTRKPQHWIKEKDIKKTKQQLAREEEERKTKKVCESWDGRACKNGILCEDLHEDTP